MSEKIILPRGGSEIAYNSLLQHVPGDWQKDINFIVSACREQLIDPTRKNIIWQQLSYDQENVMLMRDYSFTDKIDCFVYVSNWSYEKFRFFYKTPENRSLVIKNAIDPIPYKQREKGKIKLIYTSTPWRGLEVLLDAFEMLNREDVELDIYSSTIIYGTQFYQQNEKNFAALFERAQKMKNVNYCGYAENKIVRQALQQAHIFSYPSIFEETSCIAAIEAGAAGCKMVTTSYGALYETCGEYATMVPFNSDKKTLAINYAKALNFTINNYWNDDNLAQLKKQSDYYNFYYSWDYRKQDWLRLFNSLRKIKQ
jgi:UDP-glucose:(glucosyl)LPS alpha-1,2-glucosyltransferase